MVEPESSGTRLHCVATLRCGEVETSYVRAGEGPPIVLITGNDPESDSTQRTMDTLTEWGRVYAAGLPAGLVLGSDPESHALADWLRDVIDGLGLEGVVLVAGPELAGAACAFALADPERVELLVVGTGSLDVIGGGRPGGHVRSGTPRNEAR